MNTEEIKETEALSGNTASENGDDKKSFKREKCRFEFALYINDSLICKRNFPINGYVEKSMQTSEFKNEVDKIVEIINSDLCSKTRVYSWYHLPEFTFDEGSLLIPDWEPEMMTEPLIEEGASVFKFVVYDNGEEVISRIWDGRFYPTYVRKNVDLTNRQIKITKGEQTYIYDKEKFFGDNDMVSGELYVLKNMISDKSDLIPVIQKLIYEVCSSFDGYYEKITDYNTIDEYKNHDIKRDENGNAIYKQKTAVDANGNEVPVFDAFGRPWMIPVLEDKKTSGKKYYYNIDAYNKKIDSQYGAAVSEKTKKYMSELYVSPKEKYFKKKTEE